MHLLAVILEYSTIIPFRWTCNKYLCFYCCCPFYEASKLKEHTKIEHEDAKLRTVLQVARNYRTKLEVSEIKCKMCSKLLNSLEDFLDHMMAAHDLKFNREMSKDFFCFKLSDNQMKCIDCGQVFTFFGLLLTHAHKYHNKSKGFLCEICGESFVGQVNVISHKKNIHDQSTCDKCHMTFPTQYALVTHTMKVHTFKLQCPLCPEILGSRYLKKLHLATVHDVKSIQFKCEECSRVFIKRNQLIQHKARVHLKEKSVTCEICGFKVFDKDLLKKHMVRHDDSRPFECDICNKSFRRKKSLDIHRRIHTNDKRYACKDCGKAFVQPASLKLHIRVHHAGNEPA